MFRSVTPFGSHALQGERNDPFGSLQREMNRLFGDAPTVQATFDPGDHNVHLPKPAAFKTAGRKIAIGQAGRSGTAA